MTFVIDLKQTLEDRLDLLNSSCEAEPVGSPKWGELCGRYEECKTILGLVNIVVSPDIRAAEVEAPLASD